jgi:hypothetical protein
MIKQILTIAMITACFLSACKAKKNAETNRTEVSTSSETNVKITVANNTYVKKSYTEAGEQRMTITTQKEFDKIFGTRELKVDDIEATEIDFKKHYVVALVGVMPAYETRFLYKTANASTEKIDVKYRVKVKEDKPAAERPSIVVVVSKGFEGEVTIAKN